MAVARAGEADRVHSRLRGDQNEHAGRRRDGFAVAAGKFRDAVRPSVGVSFERLALQVMIDIANQRFHRAVPALGIFVHRRKAEHVEIAPLCFVGAQHSGILGGHGGWLFRLAIQDDEISLGRRSSR